MKPTHAALSWRRSWRTGSYSETTFSSRPSPPPPSPAPSGARGRRSRRRGARRARGRCPPRSGASASTSSPASARRAPITLTLSSGRRTASTVRHVPSFLRIERRREHRRQRRAEVGRGGSSTPPTSKTRFRERRVAARADDPSQERLVRVGRRHADGARLDLPRGNAAELASASPSGAFEGTARAVGDRSWNRSTQRTAALRMASSPTTHGPLRRVERRCPRLQRLGGGGDAEETQLAALLGRARPHAARDFSEVAAHVEERRRVGDAEEAERLGGGVVGDGR